MAESALELASRAREECLQTYRDIDSRVKQLDQLISEINGEITSDLIKERDELYMSIHTVCDKLKLTQTEYVKLYDDLANTQAQLLGIDLNCRENECSGPCDADDESDGLPDDDGGPCESAESCESKDLDAQLRELIAHCESNGIKQHSPQWHLIRKTRVGGSTVSSFLGVNPFSTLRDIAMEKLGLKKFTGSIATRWGTLLEDVLKRVIELVRDTKIGADNSFVLGPGCSSYSPDGIGIVNIPAGFDVHGAPVVPGRQITLLEFKCPYSSIPDDNPAGYYIVQVLMGLDLLATPTIGMLSSALFRRCTYGQLGYNPAYDMEFNAKIDKNGKCTNKLTKRQLAKPIMTYGFIGFTAARGMPVGGTPMTIPGAGQDLGTCTIAAIDNLLQATPDKVSVWYSPIRMVQTDELIRADMDKFIAAAAATREFYIPRGIPFDTPLVENDGCMSFMTEGGVFVNEPASTFPCNDFGQRAQPIVIGVLPWKLFDIHDYYINKQEGFLSPALLAKMREMMAFVDKYKDCTDAEKTRAIDEMWPAPPEQTYPQKLYKHDYFKNIDRVRAEFHGGVPIPREIPRDPAEEVRDMHFAADYDSA